MLRSVSLAIGVIAVLAGRAGAASLPAGRSSGEGGRVLFAVHAHQLVSQIRKGDDLTLVPALTLVDPELAHQPRILAIDGTPRRTVVHLTHGAVVKTSREPGRFVLEIAAAPPAVDNAGPVSKQSAAPAGMLPGLPAPMIAVVETTGGSIGARPSLPAPAATPVAPGPAVAPASSPVSIAAALVPAASDQPAGLLLPFDRTVGAAAFRRGNRLEVVFDSRKPLDLSISAGDPAFQQARLSLLPAGTLLDMPFDAGHPLTLTRVSDGWLLSPRAAATQAAVPEPQADGLIFSMAGSGDVLTVADPAGGGDLLVGTVRADMRNVTMSNRSPGYQIVPSLLGVVVERLSDRVELRPLATGFRLIDPFPPIGGYRADPTAAFSRSIQMPPVDRAEQWRRYKTCLAASASMPPGSRREPRLDAARSALALGMGTEARMLAEIADEDAPNAADRAASAFLIGAGGLLAGDADAARLLSDPLIGNSDEAALWRSLAVAKRNPSDRPAARSVAALWPLLLSYPAPLRRQLLGDAALLMAKDGGDAARALLNRLGETDGKTGLARALISEGADHNRPALAMLDRLYGDRDPDVALSAEREAVELRLRDQLVTPKEAARRMDRLIYDGRMAGRETEIAMRAAQLHAQVKDWSGAMLILRQQAQSPTEDVSDVKRAAAAVLSEAADPVPASGKEGTADAEDALQAVALLEQNQDLLPPDVDRVGLSTRLADRLVKNDLSGRATDFLRHAFIQAPAGADKARLGLALSGALLQQDDVTGARGVLDGVDRAVLSPGQAEQGALLNARLLAAAGDRPGSIAALAPLQGQDAVKLRATLLGDSGNWRDEATALTGLLAARMPNGPAGKPLDPETEDTVLRLAGALSRSGQTEAVRQLDRTWSAAFVDHGKKDMLSLLAAPDVTSVGDLPRSATDITAARGALKVLSGREAG